MTFLTLADTSHAFIKFSFQRKSAYARIYTSSSSSADITAFAFSFFKDLQTKRLAFCINVLQVPIPVLKK